MRQAECWQLENPCAHAAAACRSPSLLQPRGHHECGRQVAVRCVRRRDLPLRRRRTWQQRVCQDPRWCAVAHMLRPRCAHCLVPAALEPPTPTHPTPTTHPHLIPPPPPPPTTHPPTQACTHTPLPPCSPLSGFKIKPAAPTATPPVLARSELLPCEAGKVGRPPEGPGAAPALGADGCCLGALAAPPFGSPKVALPASSAGSRRLAPTPARPEACCACRACCPVERRAERPASTPPPPRRFRSGTNSSPPARQPPAGSASPAPPWAPAWRTPTRPAPA